MLNADRFARPGGTKGAAQAAWPKTRRRGAFALSAGHRCRRHVQPVAFLTFRDIGALDAQLDEAKIAFGEVRTLKRLSETEWAGYWGAMQEVSDRNGGTYRLPGRPWHFSRDELAPLGDPAFRGEHNRDVFHELGLSDDEIDGYIASGALVGVSVPAAAADQSRAVA